MLETSGLAHSPRSGLSARDSQPDVQHQQTRPTHTLPAKFGPRLQQTLSADSVNDIMIVLLVR